MLLIKVKQAMRVSENIAHDSTEFLYSNSNKFHELFAHDIDPAEADILAAVQKPFNQSISTEKSGPLV